MDIEFVREGAESTLLVTGAVDVDSAEEMFLAAQREAKDGQQTLIIDLAAVTEVDSSGLGTLVRCQDELGRAFDIRVILRNPSKKTRRILELTALDSHFDIVTSDVEDSPREQAG